MKKIAYVSLLVALVLVACSRKTTTTSSATETGTSQSTEVALISNQDFTTNPFGTYAEENLSTSSAGATTIELSTATTAVEGISVDGQTVTITQAGTYVLTGELSNGQVVIDVDAEEQVHLIFDGLIITNQQGPALLIEQAEKVITTLAKGSKNTLSDGSDYALTQDGTSEEATIFSQADFVLNGEGELLVNGNQQNGIQSQQNLWLISGKIVVHAKNSAFQATNSIQILDGIYTLSTETGSAIRAASGNDISTASVAIDGGQFTIETGRDGIQAEHSVSLQNANITIHTNATELLSEESYKGIQAGELLLIQSGIYTIDSSDDSLHSSGDIQIIDGELLLSSGGDAIHADNQLTVDGGKLTVSDSYTGMEASFITINEGTIQLTSSSDGLTTRGGSNTGTTTEPFGTDSFSEVEDDDQEQEIVINGGELFIDAQGDGLDSSHSILMAGGLVVINGSTNSSHSAFNYNGSFELTGGTLLASGLSSTALSSSTNDQVALGIYFETPQEAGTIISLQSTDGQIIATYQPTKDFQYLMIASPDITIGETYTLIRGNTANGTAQNGYYGQEDLVNGVELGQVTVKDTMVDLTEAGGTILSESKNQDTKKKGG